MKISINWLNEYINTNLATQELCSKLTMAGLEVEKIETINGDSVIEMEITPNRPDLLNIIGIARELSAIINKTVKIPRVTLRKVPSKKCDISIEDKKDCLRYIGTVIENMECKKSPANIINRITSLGMRSINNIVDITNFCLMETGQPLHAFDFDKLIGGKIIIRRAKKGEKIITIDEKERILDSSILVIADAKKPVAIAGLMGGKETEVSFNTKRILLESACFDPMLIRRTSRILGLSTDSSYRFERGVSFDGVKTGVDRAIDLILEYAKGKIIAKADVNLWKQQTKQKNISTSIDKINNFLKSNITGAKCNTILTKLGFIVKNNKKGQLMILAPRYRTDIKREVDIFEEVARIIGYDNLPMTMPVINAVNVARHINIEKRNKLNEIMLAQGYNEVITYSMMSIHNLQKSGQEYMSLVKVINPLTKEQEIMKPSLLPGLLSVVLSNANKGQKDLKLFEIGKRYTPKGEKETLGIVVTGFHNIDWRYPDKRESNFYDIKGVVETAIKSLGINKIVCKTNNNLFFEEGQDAEILLNGKVCGIIGKIKNTILCNWGIKQQKVFFAQIDLETIFNIKIKVNKYKPLPVYPAVVRDISLSVQQKVSFSDVQKLVTDDKPTILVSIDFKEEYLGDQIEEGRKGLVLSFVYQSPKKTLTEEEVNVVHNKIIDLLKNQLGAIQR